MSSHDQMLDTVSKQSAAMTPEQKAAFEKTAKELLEPKNLVPTWVDTVDKVIIITGANTGVGYHTAKKLSNLGRSGKPRLIVLACRNKQKGDDAAASLREETKNENIECMECDVSSLASVEKFAAAFRARNLPVDILINNAGIMGTPYAQSPDGFEMQFASNHLGHFYLTHKLLPLMKEQPDPRVLNLTSQGRYQATADVLKMSVTESFATVSESGYDKWAWYCATKAHNSLFTFGLKKRYDWLLTAAVHPGFVQTNLQANIGLDAQDFSKASGLTPLTPDRGADNSVYTAVVPGIPNGKYWNNTEPMPFNPVLDDDALVEGLWTLSENMVAKAGFSL